MKQIHAVSFIYFDILESTQFRMRPTFCFGFWMLRVCSFRWRWISIRGGSQPQSCLFFFFKAVENDLSCLTAESLWSFQEGGLGGLHRWRSTTAWLIASVCKSPILIPSSLLHSRSSHANTHTHTYCSMAGPSCCPKAWNTTFVCLHLVFFP